MLQVQKGRCLVLTINISRYDKSLTPEKSPETVNCSYPPLLQNYVNGRSLNIGRKKLNAVVISHFI